MAFADLKLQIEISLHNAVIWVTVEQYIEYLLIIKMWNMQPQYKNN